MDIISTLDCSSWDNVKKIVTCTYCKELFKKPCTLICCHTFCYSCTNSIEFCPTCQSKKFYSFKLPNFENYFLARLTKLFKNQQKHTQSSCTDCRINTKVCVQCFIIGCIKCNSQHFCIDNSKQHLSHPVDMNDSPDQLLHLFSATGYCELHETGRLIHYCYVCERMKCSECLQSCKSHKTSKLEDHSKYFVNLLESLDKVKEKITYQECIFVQHKEKLNELFQKDFDKVEKWFKHAYNCLYHEKQNTIFSLEVFQTSINQRIENFRADLAILTQSANDFQTYFTLLFNKSTDKERYSYKEDTLKITFRAKELEKAIKKITSQFENNLDIKKVFQKYFTRIHTCEGINRCDIKCKKVDNLRSHLNTEQKYKYEVISYCQALNDHDKLEADQVVINGSCYSMFSLPNTSSELVTCAKQPLTDISRCASCISQLKLYNKSVAQQDLEMLLKDKGNTIHESILMVSISKLLDISDNSIHNIERGIKHLHQGSISMYFREVQKNFDALESFREMTDRFCKSLEKFSLELQSFQTDHITQPTNIIYSNMLLDIIMDCQSYITRVNQIVIDICHTKTIIELSYIEKDEAIDDETMNCIANEGFQIEIVSHYSTWVALNEICKNSIELINNWNK